jgi:FkbM family methyltransferase
VSLASLVRKLGKACRVFRTRRYRRPLLLGVAAACEHTALFGGLPMAAVRTVIDVGANKGQFALLALELFPGAMVHAFEPLARPLARLAAWSRNEPRLIRYPLALGAAAVANAAMNVAARDDSSSLRPITGRQTALFPGTGKVGEESVTVARLDAVLRPDQLIAPVLLKIDVQGSELDVLRGASGLLGAVDWVFVECSYVELYAGQALADEVSAHLGAAGFTPVAVWNLVCDRDRRPVQADLLFRRSG